MIRPLSRRTVLRGVGAAVALPFLEAMRRSAWAEPPAEDLKLVVFFVPNGAPPSLWIPPDTGPAWTPSPILRGLDPVRSHVLVLSHLDNAPAMNGGEEHTYCTATCLSSVRPGAGPGVTPKSGVSVDQKLATFQAGSRPFASLELGSEAPGVCTLAWCAGAQHISWSGPTTPRPAETSPAAVFQRLFGGSDGAETLEGWARRQARRQSILDAVLDDAARVEQRLGHQDRTRLDEYLTSVREIETRLQSTTLPSCGDLAWSDAPVDTPGHVRQMSELIALALECGQTSIVTYMLGIARSNRPFPFLGIPESHHEITHMGGAPMGQEDPLSKLERIVRWEVEQYAWLVDRLSRVPTATGTLLDEAAVLFLSGMGDAAKHTAVDLPVLLAGRGNGAFTPGRHVAYPAGTPLARLHLALLQAAGMPVNTFGADGTEPLADLA